ncbi:MAG: phosphatase PAP2 family protein [Clostridia bacterium]|nr:phosphatase PAP2 family protein [Clostridia bacterium]
MNYFNEFEIPILDWIQNTFSCPFLDAVIPVLSSLVDGGIIWIALAVVMLFFRKTRKAGLTVGLALIFGLLTVNLMMKPMVARIRPYDFNAGADLIVGSLSDFSFPSGHVIASFEASVALLLCKKKSIGIPAIIFAVIIAFSRMYLYVHYPTDVLASIILGTGYAIIAYFVIKYIFNKYDLDRKIGIPEGK